MGHKGGAYFVIQLAVAHPERVSRIVLSGIGAISPDDIEKLRKIPMSRDIPIDKEGQFLQHTWSTYQRMSSPDAPGEAIYRPFLISLRSRLRPYDPHWNTMRWDRDAAIAQLSPDIPVMLTRGVHDPFCSQQEELAARIPNSTHRVMPNGGVFPYSEFPESAAAVLTQFLESPAETQNL